MAAMRAPQPRGGGTGLFAAQLARHPSLQRVALDTMYARHPAQVDQEGKRFVPAVHRGAGGTSLFIYPFSRYAYRDRVLADGRTIEYHSSTNAHTNGELRSLVGQEVTLYAQVGRGDAREARVLVQQPADVPEDVFHLRLVSPRLVSPPGVEPAAAAPAAPPADKKRVLWADM